MTCSGLTYRKLGELEEGSVLTMRSKKTATQKFVTRDTEHVRSSLNYSINLSHSLQLWQHDDSYDVLQRHHNRNRVPLPPNPQQLENFRSHHGNIAEMDSNTE